MENEVKILKLITGEEIITNMTKGEGGTVLLEMPMQILWDKTNPSQVQLAPWILAGNPDKVTLESSHVLVILDATEESKQNYLAAMAGIPPEAVGMPESDFGGFTGGYDGGGITY